MTEKEVESIIKMDASSKGVCPQEPSDYKSHPNIYPANAAKENITSTPNTKKKLTNNHNTKKHKEKQNHQVQYKASRRESQVSISSICWARGASG